MPHLLRESFQKRFPTVGVIDIGSNALRASIYRKVGNNLITLLSVREPLRLGEVVFPTKKITLQKQLQMEEIFIRLLHLFAEYDVTDVKCYATSAMREAKNASPLIRQIKKITGITIEIISGDIEAKLLYSAVNRVIPLKNKTAILLDLGGGSTEITILSKKGEIHSKSFPVGTIRLLQLSTAQKLDRSLNKSIAQMHDFVERHLNDKKIDMVIGTGGNLRRIGKIRKKIMNKNDHECETQEVQSMSQVLHRMSFIERIQKLEMDHHRADVIYPATLLISKFLKSIKAKKIILPKVGLKEGMLLELFTEKNLQFKNRS